MQFDERNGSSVLERAFRLLGALEASRGELPLAELARRAGLPKPTAYRPAGQLVALDVLTRSSVGYGLGTRLFEFGNAVVTYRRFRDIALPFMVDLYEATHQTVNLGIMDGLPVLYLEKFGPHNASLVSTAVGIRKPLYCTALGKAMLAFSPRKVVETVIAEGFSRHTPRTVGSPKLLVDDLKTARADGYAVDHEEYVLGTVCVAAPLRAADGVAFGAISVTGTADRWDPIRYSTATRVTALSLNRALLKGSESDIAAYFGSK